MTPSELYARKIMAERGQPTDPVLFRLMLEDAYLQGKGEGLVEMKAICDKYFDAPVCNPLFATKSSIEP
jgi:hypothetical protein